MIRRRHNRCRGFRLWKWGNFQIELWFCPRGEHIEPHVHEHIDSKIIFLAGSMKGRIADRSGLVSWPRHMFSSWRVPKGVMHSARVGAFCVFANLERWDGPPTSAAEDFTAA